MNKKVINVHTATDGSFTWQRGFAGRIHAIEVLLGSGPSALSTPDVDITDDTYSNSYLSVNGVASDIVYYPSTYLETDAGSTTDVAGTGVKAAGQAICVGVLKVAVTGGGDTKRGKINVFWD